jgi:hypothetical protein
MNIPLKIKICGIEYSVEDIISDSERDEKMGTSRMSKSTIKIDKKLPIDRQHQTFLHESIHMILDESGFFNESKDEKLINCLANNIYQLIKDNKLIFFRKK